MTRPLTVLSTLALALFSLVAAALALQPAALAETGPAAAVWEINTCTERSLDDALASAVDGDTIWLHCWTGPSSKPVTVTLLTRKTIDKSLTISGTHSAGRTNRLSGGDARQLFDVTASKTLTLAHIVLQDGHAPFPGGCIMVNGSLVAIDTIIARCRTDTLNGGAIMARSGAVVTLQNSDLISNTAGGSGGGLYATGATVTISGGRIEKNTAGLSGGGLYLTATVPSVTGATIEGNQAQHDGGGIYNSKGSLTLAGSALLGNHAADSGGGLWNNGVLNMQHVAFIGNDAGDSGAGLYGVGGAIEAGTNLTFTNNSAGNYGGGLSLSGGAGTYAVLTDVLVSGNSAFAAGGFGETAQGAVSLHRATIISNSAENIGGGLATWSGAIEISDSTVLSNTVSGPSGHGGGLWVGSTVITVSQSTISGNATPGANGNGAGLYVSATTTLSMFDSQMTGNRAGDPSRGGGLYMFGGVAHLGNVVASGNRAGSPGEGGGLYLQEVTAVITGLTARDNDGGGEGGGIFARLGDLTLRDSRISGNAARYNGGGMYLEYGAVTLERVIVADHVSGTDYGAGIGCMDCEGIWQDLTISGNVADAECGGLYTHQATLQIHRSLFDRNAAGNGGGMCEAFGDVSLTNATFSANHAVLAGGGIYAEPGAAITLTNVTMKGNAAGAGGAVWIGTNSSNQVHLKNTVLADSPTGGNCGGRAPDSAGFSLSTDFTCALAEAAPYSNRNGVAAGLTPLAWLGGQTLVHLPKLDSLLVDMIQGPDFPATDQRGYARPIGLAADVGAVERQDFDPAYPPVLFLPLVARQ